MTDDPSSHRGDTGHRFLARLGNVLRREGRSLGASLRDPVLGGLLLLSLLLAALVCQIKVPFVLDVGQRPDEVYLTGFHAAQQGEGQIYRWSTGEARLLIPGLGSTPYHLDLVIDAARESGQAPPLLRLEVAGRPLLQEVIQPGFRSYSILLPPEALRQGTLDLVLRSDTVTSTRDSRPLGVALERVKVRPAGSFLVLPPWPLLLWAVLTVLLAVLLARRLGWSRWPALGMGTVVALALAASLAWARPLLAPGMPFLPLGFAAAWAAVVVAQGMVRSLFARGGAELDPRAERALWSIAALFLVVRLAGSLHPALATWDLCFHWHRLGLVARGQVLFTILSGEWRGLETFYLPSLYIVLAPFWAVFGGRLALLKVAGILLDTSSALLVAYIARRLLGRGQVAGLAALLYLTMPQSYIIFSWGIVANIFGQWLLLLVLALVVSPASPLERWRTWLVAAGLLIPAALAHPGTVLLTAALLGAFLLTVLLAPLASWSRQAVWRWVGAGLVAAALAALLYYGHFAGTMWASFQQMGQGASMEQPSHGGILVRGPAEEPSLGLQAVEVGSRGEALLAGVRELAAEARAYYRTGPLLLALVAPLGFALERRPLAVRLAGLAFVVALFFAVVGLATNLYVRYMYFLLPFVAVGAAWWLARIAGKRWAGRAVAAAWGLYLFFLGLFLWGDWVLYYAAACR